MKKLIILLLVFVALYSNAQSPQTFNYQAVVRDALGVVIENQNVGIKIDILQSSSSGTIVYSEEHSVTTNQFGLVNLEIGGGSLLSGDFASINWGSDVYFIQTELDPTGGTTYQLMGVSQLLAVPYSMYASQAGNVNNSDTSATNELQDWATLPGIPADFSDGVDNVDDADADPTNELNTSIILNGTNLETTDAGGTIITDLSVLSNNSLWQENVNDIYYDAGNVGIGAVAPNGRLLVQSDASAGINDDIFSVLNANGDTVFAVYQEGVRIWVDDNGGTKANGSRGGFAVGGFSPTKAGVTNEYLVVTPDSVRVYIDDDFTVQANGSRGGFAVGGFSPTKGSSTDNYLFVQDDSTRVYTGDPTKGFGVKNINGTAKESYMQLTPNNYFIGHESGDNNTSGLYNSFFGYKAGQNNQSGSDNIFIGYQSGFSNLSGASNVSLGNNALYLNNGSDNIAIGNNALLVNSAGGYNVAIGTDALMNNTINGKSVAIGYQALRSNNTGWSNVAIGNITMYYNTTGTSNCAIGEQALYHNTTGGTNVAIGNSALNYNNGSNNTAVGAGAFYSLSATSRTNSTALGAYALINASNKVRIGATTVTVIEGQVAYTFPSDARFKFNVKEEVKGLEFITKLRPITYQFDTEKFDEFLIKDKPDNLRDTDYKESSSIIHTGFIAQEVEQAAKDCGFVFDGVNVPKNEDENYGVAYSQFTVPLVKAVQELNTEVEKQKEIIDKLLQRIDDLENK